ncbi:MAG: hypothetical protein DMG06_22200 [Acidobacteria bacterium]|nr:MAG: hypothetical protein DMG06_22200 [Acidobacteriota bacterium]
MGFGISAPYNEFILVRELTGTGKGIMKVLSLKKLSKTLVFARTSQEKINLVQALTLVVWLLFLTSFFTILFFGYTQISLPQYSVDDIARADVVVPFDVFVEDETEGRPPETNPHLFTVTRRPKEKSSLRSCPRPFQNVEVSLTPLRILKIRLP